MDLPDLASKVTGILVSAAPYLIDKVENVALNEGIKKLGYTAIAKLNAVFEKIRSKENESIKTAVDKLSNNQDDQDAKNELQQEILKLLKEDPNLVREVESIVTRVYTQGFRPVIDPKKIFGREKDLEKIENLLEANSALVITGLRGTGKSILTSMFIDRIEKTGKFADIYWRKVDETTDISDIISSFFTVIGKPVKNLERSKIPDQIYYLFQELNEASYLLILDNFEIILDPQTNKPLESKVGFSELIENAKENCTKSKVLFTSWDSLASERGIRPFSYQIKGLDESASILLLKREGVDEPEAELKKAVELSGGHPLALILLAQLVSGGAGRLSVLLKEDSLWRGEVAENIFNKVYTERLSEDKRKLLQYVSVFRQPVPSKAISKVANDHVWTESIIEQIAWKLYLKSLLQKKDENYWEESLVSKYTGTHVSNKFKLHKLAYEYYLSLPIPEKPTKKEDIQYLIEAHYHACMAGEYDQAFNIIFDKNLHEYLDLWGNYTVLVDLYSKLLPDDHFGTEILLKDKRNHGIVLGNLGLAYRDLGETRKAIEYYKQALKIAKEIGDRQNEGIWLGNLGSAYSDLGETRKAIEYYEQALKIAKEIGDRRREGIWLGNLGSAYSDLGETRKAIEYYEQALKIAKEIEDRKEEGNRPGNLGNVYRNLGETRKAIEYYEQALKIAKEIGDRKGEGMWLGNLGLAYRDLGETRKAFEYYEQALKIAKEIGDRQNEEEWLGNLGVAYNDLREPKKAIEHSKLALKIAKEIGDKKGEGKCLGNLGIIYNDLGRTKKAIGYYKLALKIAKKIEDSRLIDFCERNLEKLKI